MNYEAIYKYVDDTLSEKRMKHTRGCIQAAEELAIRFGADVEKVRIAALLHDVTKEYSKEKQLKTIEDWDIIVDDTTLDEPALLHAVTGAELARRQFGADDEIVNAIRYHSTGSEYMTLFDKIVCLADCIEPNRTHPGVEEIRQLAQSSIDYALIAAFRYTIFHTLEKNGVLHPDTVLARNTLIKEVMHNRKVEQE